MYGLVWTENNCRGFSGMRWKTERGVRNFLDGLRANARGRGVTEYEIVSGVRLNDATTRTVEAWRA